MILKALYDYYHRRKDLPAMGAELKEIAYVIVIDREGRFLRFEDKRIDKKQCQKFCVPKSVKRTSAPITNVLWDNGKYVIAAEAANMKCHLLFMKAVRDIADAHPENASIQSLRKYFERPHEERLAEMMASPLWPDVERDYTRNFSFQIEGDDRLVAEMTELYPDNAPEDGEAVYEAPCLVTGKHGRVTRLFSSTMIPGCSAGASIISMQKKSGYDSYGKEQTFNAPISLEAEFAIATAMNTMLGKDSQNKYTIGPRTFLFWSSDTQDGERQEETMFFNVMGMSSSKGKKDDPDSGVRKAHDFFKSIWSGKIKTTLDDRFYVLGLAPNAGRIAVVSFADVALKDFAANILKHFDDMEIADTRKAENRYPVAGLYTILGAVTLDRKVSDAQANLVEGVMQAIVDRKPYPHALFTAALARIRAELHERQVTIERAAILKAAINRMNNPTNEKQIEVMLDKTNDNIGYLCGRLAGVLEKIQEDAKSGDSIRTSFMTAASATPAAVFHSMLNLSVHHSEKLSTGSRIFYEQLKQEIIDKIPSSGFPAHLDLTDQGRFFVGYYHQRADLFTKKDDNKTENQ